MKIAEAIRSVTEELWILSESLSVFMYKDSKILSSFLRQ